MAEIKYTKIIKVLLEQDDKDVRAEQVTQIINSILNEKKYSKNNTMLMDKYSKDILNSIKKQLEPYTYTDNQKKELQQLIYKIVNVFSQKNQLSKVSQNLQNKNVFYDCTLLLKVKEHIEKESKKIFKSL